MRSPRAAQNDYVPKRNGVHERRCIASLNAKDAGCSLCGVCVGKAVAFRAPMGALGGICHNVACYPSQDEPLLNPSAKSRIRLMDRCGPITGHFFHGWRSGLAPSRYRDVTLRGMFFCGRPTARYKVPVSENPGMRGVTLRFRGGRHHVEGTALEIARYGRFAELVSLAIARKCSLYFGIPFVLLRCMRWANRYDIQLVERRVHLVGVSENTTDKKQKSRGRHVCLLFLDRWSFR